MLPLRHYKRWRLAGIIILLAVVVATFTPTNWLLPILSRGDFLLMDKWLHMLTFLFLSLWFTGQYARRSYWRLAAGLTAFGVLIELGQALISYRTAEWQDLVADVFGTAVGLVIASAGTGGWSLRFEQWLENGTAGVD